MNRHLGDDVLVLSIRHGGRLGPRQRRHLLHCPQCRSRHEDWQARLPGRSMPSLPAPYFSVVAPRLSHRKGAVRHLAMASIAVAVLALFTWPRMMWPDSPWGPMALATLMTTPPVTLKSTSPTARGTVSVIANRQAGWLLVSYRRLSPLPAGHVYEAWWIQKGHHIRAGVFGASGGTRSVWLHTSHYVGQAVALGITVEPAPGTMRPTEPKQFGAKL